MYVLDSIPKTQNLQCNIHFILFENDKCFTKFSTDQVTVVAAPTITNAAAVVAARGIGSGSDRCHMLSEKCITKYRKRASEREHFIMENYSTTPSRALAPFSAFLDIRRLCM